MESSFRIPLDNQIGREYPRRRFCVNLIGALLRKVWFRELRTPVLARN